MIEEKKLIDEFNKLFVVPETKETYECWVEKIERFNILHIREWIESKLHSHRTTILNEVKERVEEMESHINYHDEDGVRILHDQEIGISMKWEEGHNYAIKKVLTTIEEMKDK